MVSNRDFRKLDMATQAELRRVAVGMVQAGKTRAEAAATVGVGRRYVGEWVAAVERSGEGALAGGRRGRRPGEQKTLSPAQEKKIKGLIARKCPDQLGLPFALWTREAVGMLIERETGKRFSSRSTIGGYLGDWGFTPQRPRKLATERHEPTVQRWLEHDYPAIVKRAKTEGADIHWGDECGVSNQANYGRSFAPRGQTPVIPRPATPSTCSMIYTLPTPGPDARHPPTGNPLHLFDDLPPDQPRHAALHDLRRRADGGHFPSLPATPGARRPAQGVPHCRQPARPPRQAGHRLGADQQRPDRIVLPAAIRT